jgi:hypothetical protein
MAQVKITDLPNALALTGFESVPIVQNGVTVQTTTGAISVQPTQTQTFLTATQQPSLANSRYLAAGSGLQIIDGGAQGTLQINMTGAAASLNSSSNGIQVKTALGTLTARSIAVGTGLGITNANGVAGDPLISLGSFLANFQSMSGSTGLVGVKAGVVSPLSIVGTSSNIAVTNGDGSTGNPTINLVATAVTPGTYSSATFTVDQFGRLTSASSGTAGGVTFFSAGTTGFTPSTPTSGSITLDGVLVPSNGGTGASSLTGYVYGNGTGTMTASTTIPNAGLANSSITINSTSVSLGGTINVGTVTSVAALTLGTSGTDLSSTVATGTTTPVITLNVPTASATNRGALSAADWTTFNSKQPAGTYVTSVTGTSPVVSSNGTTPAISLASGYGDTQNPYASKTANYVLAAPNGSAGAPTFRALVAADIPALPYGTGTVTSVSGTGTVNGLTLTGTVTTSGSLTLGGTLSNIANSALTNSSITINGNSVSLGGSTTVTATTTSTLTIGTGLSGTSFNGSTPVTIANTGVLSFSGGTTGLTPATATTGAISLAGTLVVGNGGTGVTTLTGLAYGNGTSAFTAATAAQVVSVIGSTAVTNATNATNVGVTANSTNAPNYLTFVSATSGNLPELVNSAITCNPSTGQITGGVAGGAF